MLLYCNNTILFVIRFLTLLTHGCIGFQRTVSRANCFIVVLRLVLEPLFPGVFCFIFVVIDFFECCCGLEISSGLSIWGVLNVRFF
jgi:hypothetical protein